MKRKLKSLLLAVSMLVAMVAMTACGSSDGQKDAAAADEQSSYYVQMAEQLATQIASFTDDQIETIVSQGNEFEVSTLESWKSAKDELGAFESVTSSDTEADGDNMIVTLDVKYEKATATVELIVDTADQTNPFSSMSFNVNYSLAVLMQRAAMNTVMGIGIVFLMLLFLSVVIGLFKYMSAIEKRAEKKPEPAAADDDVPTVVLAEKDEELADDTELVAVIAAAIAAYEDAPADGFVVRSIKKSNKWRRA